MKSVITGISRLKINELDEVTAAMSDRTGSFRYVHDLEKLTVAAIELLLRDAAIDYPVGKDTIGLYLGIDNAVEDIKNEFFENIVREGVLGASPLIFPFTSPNALAAQATILFDLRGESAVFPVRDSIETVIEYADECISGDLIQMAIAGGITVIDDQSTDGVHNYQAVFYFLENPDSAKDRGVRIYENVPEAVN